MNGSCSRDEHKKILMSVNSLRGHAAPVMALAAELVRRGHHVTFCTGKEDSVYGNRSSLWEDDAHPKVRFVHAYDHIELMNDINRSLGLGNKESDLWMNWAKVSDYTMCWQVMVMMDTFHERLFPVIDKLLQDEGGFDLIITDYTNIAALDAACKHNVPFVINAPAQRVAYNCKTCATFPAFGFKLPMKSSFHRFLNHLALSFDPIAFFLRRTQKIRKKFVPRSIYSITLMDHAFKNPVLYNTVIGVSEVAQYEPPLSYHVGALLPKVQREALVGSDSDQSYLQLSKELKDWFDGVPEGTDVIFINFGTTGAIPQWKYNTMLESFELIPKTKRPYVLWRISKDQQDALGIKPDTIPENMKLSSWIEPSQQAVLSHPKVKLFVTHAGINSPQEGLVCGLPLLMMPVWADQPGHAARLTSHGLGQTMSKWSKFSASSLAEALTDLLFNHEYYARNVRKARKLLQRAGGTDRAADLVEEVLESGYSHLIPGERHLSKWQSEWNLDILLGYGLLAGGFGFLSYTAWIKTTGF